MQMSRSIDIHAATLCETNGQGIEALDQAHGVRVRMIWRKRGQYTSAFAPVTC